MRARTSLFLLTCIPPALSLAGCARSDGDRITATAHSRVASLTLSPSTRKLVFGRQITLEAIALDSAGHPVPGVTVAFQSLDSSMARITSSGEVSAMTAGELPVSLQAEGVTSTATVHIDASSDADVARVSVYPSVVTLSQAENIQLHGNVTDESGDPVLGQDVVFTSSNPEVADVSADGIVWASAPGTATIRAESGGHTGTAQVTVSTRAVARLTTSPRSMAIGIGESRAIAATALDDAGNVLESRAVGWQSSDKSIASVSPSGTVIGRSHGRALITAYAGRSSVSTEVSVAGTATPSGQPPLARASLRPSVLALREGQSTAMIPTITNVLGRVVAGFPMSWWSSDASVAQVGSSGIVTAKGAGTARITMSVGGITAAATVIVRGDGSTGSAGDPGAPDGANGSDGSGSSQGSGGDDEGRGNPEGQGATGWPNLPDGLRLATNQSWSSMWSHGWGIGGSSRFTSIVDDLSPDGSHSLQITFPAGFRGGSAPATAFYDFKPLAKEVFVGMWFKTSPSWQGHESDVNKIQFLLPHNGSDIYMTMKGNPGGPYYVMVMPQWSQYNVNVWLRQNVRQIPMTLGRWTRIEWYVKYESEYGRRDGIVRWWIDGQLVGNYTNLGFPADGGFIEHQLSPTWGGVGDTKDQTDWFRYGHVSVWRR